MSAEKISDHVDKAFSDPGSREYAEAYLEALRANNRDRETSYRRILILVLLLCIAFELLTRATVTEMSILGAFKVKDLSFIQKLLPLAVGFLYYELTSLYVLGLLMNRVHDVLLRKIHEPIYENNLEHYLNPSSTFITMRILTSETQSQGRLQVLVTHVPFYLAILFIGFGFEPYALFKLWSAFWPPGPVVVFVTVATVVLLIMSGLSYKYASQLL